MGRLQAAFRCDVLPQFRHFLFIKGCPFFFTMWQFPPSGHPLSLLYAAHTLEVRPSWYLLS
eukprot:2824085-Amphidinium_carterae.1